MNLKALFQATLEASCQGGLFILLLFVVRPIMGARVPAGWRQSLWFLVLIRLLIPSNLFPENPARAFSPAAIERPIETATLAIDRVAGGPGIPDWLLGQNDPSNELEYALPPLPSPRAARPSMRVNWWTVAGVTWLIGGLTLAAGIAVSTNRFRRRLRADSTEPESELLSIWKHLCEQHHLRKFPAVRVTKLVDSPTLFGVFSPLLLLPRGDHQALSEMDWEHIFLHELAHYRRRDHWQQVVQLGALCVHWFNPFVWLGLRGMRADRELAADEWAIRQLPAERSLSYGDTLLKVIGAQARPSMFQTSMGIAESRSGFASRLRRIAGFRPFSVAGTVVGIAVTLVFSAALLGRQAADLAAYTDLTPQNALVTAADKGDDAAIRALLDQGANVNGMSTLEYPKTALVAAAEAGRLETLRLLLARGAPFYMPNEKEGSSYAVLGALRFGHPECANYLLEKGAECDPLVFAAAEGNLAEIGTLITEDNRKAETLRIMCEIATMGGHAEAFGLLLDEIRAIPGKEDWDMPVGCIERVVAAGYRDVVEVMIERCPTMKHGVIRLSAAADKTDGMREWLIEKGLEVPEPSDGEALVGAAERENLVEIGRLLDAGTDIEFQGESGWTALSKAATWGRPAAVKLLLERGAYPSKRKGGYWLPLSLAKTPEIAEMLFQKGADPNDKNGDDGNGSAAIEYGVTFGTAELVSWFIEKGVDPTKVKSDEPTLLFSARNPEIAALLIGHGVDVNAKNESGRTALYSILEWSDSAAVAAKVLLDAGADANQRDNHGGTPLMEARDAAAVDVLVAAGADVHAISDSGFGVDDRTGARTNPDRLAALERQGFKPDYKKNGPSKLSGAVQGDQLELARAILANGVDPDSRNTEGGRRSLPPLFIAIFHGKTQMIKLLRDAGAKAVGPLAEAAALGDLAEMKVLLETGTDVDERSVDNWTPLHFAVGQGQSESVKLLLEKGANVNLFDESGNTVQAIVASLESMMKQQQSDSEPPLIPGVRNQQEGLAVMASIRESIDARRPDPNTRNQEGWTALQRAAVTGRSYFVLSLLEMGGDVDLARPDGMTPLMLAIANKPADAKLEITVPSKDGKPEEHLSRYGHFAKSLLAAHADTSLRNREGKTAFDLAKEKGDEEMLRLLQDAAP